LIAVPQHANAQSVPEAVEGVTPVIVNRDPSVNPTEPLTAPAAVPVAVAQGEYVLQRGDDVEIRAYNQPELDSTLRIRPDGKVSLLLLNDVQAAGLTPAQLSQFLTEAFSKHFRRPRITVIVKSFAAQTVYVGGEVAQPAA